MGEGREVGRVGERLGRRRGFCWLCVLASVMDGWMGARENRECNMLDMKDLEAT